MDLFTNYRKNWRNPSTHDYELFFRSEEAFLAIVSVSAFIHVLLDQILEKLSSKKLPESPPVLNQSYPDIPDTGSDFLKLVSGALLNMGTHLPAQDTPNEHEIVGLITGYIQRIDESIKIDRDFRIKSGTRVLRPDLILNRDGQRLIIEVKSHRSKVNTRNGVDQLLTYLGTSGITQGILFYAPKDNPNSKVRVETFDLDDQTFSIVIIE
jgi:hypothetical protein